MQNKEDNFICIKCQHFRMLSGGCDAFPDGIPDEILENNKHNKPIPGQNNKIVFKKGESLEWLRTENND